MKTCASQRPSFAEENNRKCFRRLQSLYAGFYWPIVSRQP
jgi:hypothetical protein